MRMPDLEDIRAAERRIRPLLPPTPLLSHPLLDTEIGSGIRVLVKHENHQPTGAFKVRNGLAALTSMERGELDRGVVAATRGNHGQGLAWAGRHLGVTVTICVPLGNNPEKNAAMVALGAELIEEGRTYDDSVEVAERVAAERGGTIVHSTEHLGILSGAGTIALEIVEQAPSLDAILVSVGGGSQAVGAITVTRALRPEVEVFAVQAAAAPAIHDAWHCGRPETRPVGKTLADGLATGRPYATFERLREGLAGFVTVTEPEIEEGVRQVLRTTHNLVEGSAAATVAGLMKLRQRLAGRTVAIVLSGANIDAASLARIVAGR